MKSEDLYIKSGSTGHTFKGVYPNMDRKPNYAVKIVAYPKKEKYGDMFNKFLDTLQMDTLQMDHFPNSNRLFPGFKCTISPVSKLQFPGFKLTFSRT